MELRATPVQGRSRRTVESFIAAAEALIVEDGNVSFTADRLSKHAGTSIGRVYYWFSNLPAVVDALMERIESDTRYECGITAAVAAHPALPVLVVDGSTGLQHRALNVVNRAVGLAPGDQRALALAALHLPWLDPATRHARHQLIEILLGSASSNRPG